MSLITNSLRSHFFKHLLCTTTSSPARFPSQLLQHLIRLNSFPARHHQQFVTSAIAFSTLPSSSSSSLELQATSSSFAAPYLSVNIRCRRSVSELLSESLLCFGASSVSLDVCNNINIDEEIYINCTFSISQDVKECLSCAADSIGLKETPDYVVETQDHTDWINEFQESFFPVEVLEGLWIVPEWRTPPDLGASNIILNPGLAFGTGEHPTTKMCLLLLRDSIKGCESFLDYGTGSGILAIAALKFGAAYALGLDIDSQAVTSARHNATLNGITPDQFCIDLVSDQSEDERSHSEAEMFDIVVANILLNPLLDLAKTIVSYAKPGAIVGLSGIISEQIPVIIEHYSQYLESIEVAENDGWACISGSKKHNTDHPK